MQKTQWAALALFAVAASGCQKLRAKDDRSDSKPTAKSAGASLTGDEAAPSIELITPGGPYTVPNPELRWTPLDTAQSYDVLVDDSEACTSPLQFRHTTATTSLVDFLDNGVYFACVVARDAHGKVLARATGSFWILAQNVADPAEQNGQGGSGSALSTSGLIPFPLFQDDWTQKQLNRDGHGPRQNGVASPSAFGAFADPADGARLKLLVNDRGNHRVLVFGSIPTRPDAQPDVVIGQTDFISGKRGGGDKTASNTAFADNVHVSVCPDGQMLVTDRGNNRVLVWRQIPRASGEPADLVIGQTDFLGSEPGTSATELNQPFGAYCMGGKLLILDRGNYRILVYNSVPTHSGAAADFAIGQPDFTAKGPGCSDNHFGTLADALYADGHLYVADSSNNRVVVFDSLPTRFGAKASVALGQPSLRSCKANRGRGADADTLSGPSSLAFRDGMLAVGDLDNHRVLFFNLPLTSGKDADYVLGQPDMVTVRAPDVPEFGTLEAPKGLVFDGSYMWVADYEAKRIAVLPLPF